MFILATKNTENTKWLPPYIYFFVIFVSFVAK